MRVRLAFWGLLGWGLLLGLGSGEPVAAPPSGPSSSGADTVVVKMTNGLDFTPDSLVVEPGTVIVFENTSMLMHTVTAHPDSAADRAHVQLPENVAPFGSSRLDPGQRFTRTFRQEGHYRYVCLPHEAAGMTGSVIVQAP